MISRVIAWYNAGRLSREEAEKALQRYVKITAGEL